MLDMSNQGDKSWRHSLAITLFLQGFVELQHLSYASCAEKINKIRFGVAMGSPLGSLPVNVLCFSIEENLEREGKLPSFFQRYVDDTLNMLNMARASNFLDMLNKALSSVK